LFFVVVVAALFFVCVVSQQQQQQQQEEVAFSLERTDLQQMFLDWVIFYGKMYSSAQEEQFRFENFVASIKRAKALNEEHNSPNLFGITKFSDLTVEEFEAAFLMKNNLLESESFIQSLHKLGDEQQTIEEVAKKTNPHGFKIQGMLLNNGSSLVENMAILDSDAKKSVNHVTSGWAPNTVFDWRYNNVTTAIKDQGQCGSCWAFSATSQIESNHALAYSLPPPLSPQQIVDCDILSNHCDGGVPLQAYEYVELAGGLETDVEYPYKGVKQHCHDNGTKVVDIDGFRPISLWNETGMLEFLILGGPISICLNAKNFETYSGHNGILPGSTCNPILINHCVQLTGFLTDNHGDVVAWNVRNSWGTGWGNNGYGFLQFGVNACNLDLTPSVTFPKA